MSKLKILIIFGTRPEAIKFAPLYFELKKSPEFEVKVCSTGQHKELLEDVLIFFNIFPDYHLDVMAPSQSLSTLTSKCILGIEGIIPDFSPDIIFVQGDTTTALSGALVGFYNNIPVAHLEAGLRSGNKFSPFPEEINRQFISKIATYHFTPTNQSSANLKSEGINQHIYQVGNTVIDAMLNALNVIENIEKWHPKNLEHIDFRKKIILVTSHRRENFGEPLENLCKALIEIIEFFPDIRVVFSVHPNPNVQQVVKKKLSNVNGIDLVPPLDYPSLIWLMSRSYFIITDSGGIQEEAPSLGKPVLVFRNETERQEGIQAGVSRLVGTNKKEIVTYMKKILTENTFYQSFNSNESPYGDGDSAKKIVDLLKQIYKQ